MTVVREDLIITLLLYLLTSQGKVYSDVLLKDKSENITCNGTEGKEKFVWYKYDAEFLFNYATDNKTFAPPSDGGIFTCDKKNTGKGTQIAVNCTTQNIIIIPAITGNYDGVPKNITKSIGQNVSFQTQFFENISYTLLWIVKRQSVSKCIYSVTQSIAITSVETSLNPLCCSSDGIKDEERIKFRNLTALHKPNQTVALDLVNLTSSVSGEYTCIKLSCDQTKWKWNILRKFSLEVTGGEGSPFYIIAGSIGGFIAVVAGLLLTIFCIKNRGKQKKLNRSSPAGVPDDYECMPYAVSERKEKSNNMYSLAQYPVPTTDAEYCEVQLTDLALPSAHTSKSDMKANIVPDAEYAEVMKKEPLNENDACHAYSVVNLNKKENS
ncbi:uncharacterized protein [Eleutherodactylus coqui]|uniref:uncharacterized protein isoform X3 n=1 Tax=Eleutherodactylus coqui TaxID=57060 RepID=UPI003461BADB